MMKKGKTPREIIMESLQDDDAAQPKASAGTMEAEMGRLKLQVDMLMQLRRENNERFSKLDSGMGELRSMVAQREKDLNSLRSSSLKVIDVVEQVNPEKFIADMQRKDAKIASLESKLEAFGKVNEQIMREFRDMKASIQPFRGLQEIQKLTKDMANDIASMKAVEQRVNADSDKAERMFMEFQRKYEQMLSYREEVNKLSDMFSSISKQFEGLKLKSTDFASREELTKLSSRMQGKLTFLDGLSGKDMRSIAELIAVVESLRAEVARAAQESHSSARSVSSMQAGLKSLKDDSDAALPEAEKRIQKSVSVLERSISSASSKQERAHLSLERRLSSLEAELKELRELRKAIRLAGRPSPGAGDSGKPNNNQKPNRYRVK